MAKRKEEWLKLAMDDVSIMRRKRVMRAEGGYVAWCVYSMLQAICWKMQHGIVAYDDIPYSEEEIAEEIGIGVSAADVRRSIEILRGLKMVEIVTVESGLEAVAVTGFDEAIESYIKAGEDSEKEASRKRIGRAVEAIARAPEGEKENVTAEKLASLSDDEREKVREKLAALPAPKKRPGRKPKPKNPTKLEEEFEEVWSEYPRKQGKTAACNDYVKARKKGVTKETILEGIERYKQYIDVKNIDPQYIKQGSSWFHQCCWTDEYDMTPPPQDPQNGGGKPPRDLGARPEREATPAQAAWSDYILEMQRRQPNLDSLPEATRKALAAIEGDITWPAFEAAFKGVTA